MAVTTTYHNQEFRDGVLVNEGTVEVDVTAEVVTLASHQDARDAVAGLRQIRDSTGTLTGAQLSAAVRLLAKVQLRLIQLLVGADLLSEDV